MIKLVKTVLKVIEPMRLRYLESLPEFQELYLELLVGKSEYFLINRDGELTGYCIKTAENTLVEFYLENRTIPGCVEIFKAVITDLSITKVVCKSFDFLLLNCCLELSAPVKLIGTLFRDSIEAEQYPVTGYSVRVAEASDYPFLLQQKDGLYDSPEELETFVNGGNLYMFEKDGVLTGCGYLIRVHSGWEYYDIGMWVNPDYRKQGMGTMIISFLKETCKINNWKAICGCSYENKASQKTLEKNGFISRHKLLEFSLV